MKKLILLVLVAVAFASCQKTEEAAPVAQDVVFSGIDVSGTDQKSTDVDCSNPLADYASIMIDGQTYTPAVFYLDGIAYTQAIKLTPSANYSVGQFMLMNDNGTAANMDDDYIVKATPLAGADFADYIEAPLSFTFEVKAFEKAEIGIEVLCYDQAEYSKFGFNWFQPTQIVLRELCFFGDVCLDGNPYTAADFNGSLYGTDLGIDVPAIMQIVVKNNGEEVGISAFDNEGTHIGAPLCVQYPDNLNEDGEVFTFEMSLLLPDGNGGFAYELYHTFTSTDDGALDVDAGTDGIVDFVLGSCNYSATDLQLEW